MTPNLIFGLELLANSNVLAIMRLLENTKEFYEPNKGTLTDQIC